MSESLTEFFFALTPERVLDAIELEGDRCTGRFIVLNSYENRVYQIGLEGAESIIVKFYRPQRWSKEQILEEHEFSWELAELEIPVIPPIKFAGEETLLTFEEFDFSVFPQIIGRPPELDNLDNLLVMGRFVGRIHLVGVTKHFLHRPTLSIEDFGISSREFLLDNDFIPADLSAAYDSLTKDLIDKVTAVFESNSNMQNIRIHGDCHPGNVLWKAGTPNFVDFDDTLTGPAIQDLWMMLSGDRDQKQAQLLELVEGYNEFYDFKVAELGLIESLRTLRQIRYSAWLARRWQDPAFPMSFPWFNTERYWAEHILELREQLAILDEPPLRLV